MSGFHRIHTSTQFMVDFPFSHSLGFFLGGYCFNELMAPCSGCVSPVQTWETWHRQTWEIYDNGTSWRTECVETCGYLFVGGVIIGKIVGAPWDGNNLPHIHLSGYLLGISPFKGLLVFKFVGFNKLENGDP